MNDFLKGNFKTKRDVKEKESDESSKSSGQKLADEVRKKALSSLGGSMVYVERTDLTWDGDAEESEK